jgi:MFS family permease
MLSVVTYLSSNLIVVWLLLFLATIALYSINGPVYAMIQALVPERMRAVSVALVIMMSNLIGMGLGPLAAGALSEFYEQWLGGESLRYALLTLTPGYLWAAWHAWKASRTVASDIGSSRDWNANIGREPRATREAVLGTRV